MISNANTFAVSMVQDGNTEGAYQLLRCALAEVKEAIAGGKQIVGPAISVRQTIQTESMCTVFSNTRAFRTNKIQVRNEVCLGRNADGAFAFYDKLLLPSLTATREAGAGSHEVLAMAAAALMYNLAWIRHKIGLCHGTSAHLLGAIQLYELAGATLSDLTIHLDDWIVAGVFQLKCCICNNLGHAYEQLGEAEKGRQVLASLVDLLDESELYVSDPMSEEDFDFFVQYIAMNPNLSFCTALSA